MKTHPNLGGRLTLLAALIVQAGAAMAQTLTVPYIAPTTTTTTTTPTTTTTTTTTTTATTAPVFTASPSLTLVVPTTIPTTTCAAVPAGTATRSQVVSQTFIDNFNNFDLSTARWTPHYDGGYDAVTRQWLGYDWLSKRTAPGLHEQEIYVDAGYRGTAWASLGLNPFVATNGTLHILAQRTPPTLAKYLYNYPFTSGLITTRRSFTARYGYFEMSAKVPAGQALVPAFWMLPGDRSWPPELDIMEAPGQEPDKIVTTVHWKDPVTLAHKSSGCRTSVPGFAGGFHTYGALWTVERVVYYIDRVPVAQIATPPGMNVPMYMIANLAVGGDWAGMATTSTPIPTDFEIDWITAYTTGSPTACAVLANGVKQCPGI